MTGIEEPRELFHDDLMITTCSLLEELLAEVKRGNNVERTGAVSSVEIKFLANGTPQPAIKAYAGSVPPVEEALEAYGRVFRQAQERQMAQWQEPVDTLRVAP